MIFYRMNPLFKKGGGSGGEIYGVEWDGSSTTVWTRTDDAVGLPNPNPYYVGMSGTPSSPFDDISPWKDMVISENASAGTVVAIPKFYYKLSRPESSPTAGLKIQISMSQFDGSHVSPAHMDRGDGVGERDVVYVGRYHCTNTYKSENTSRPFGGQIINTYRSNIHDLGSNIWQIDYLLRFTIQLLYLVEFADWNSQNNIGYGCGNGQGYEYNGYTDSMPYHTGTMRAGRTSSYGFGTQYRNIEGLWDNVLDHLDGCFNNSKVLNIILKPTEFGDESKGIIVDEQAPNGRPSKFKIVYPEGLCPMIIPVEMNGSDTTYSCDFWATQDKIILCGGFSTSPSTAYGLFGYKVYNGSYPYEYYGSRLMILP